MRRNATSAESSAWTGASAKRSAGAPLAFDDEWQGGVGEGDFADDRVPP